MNGLAMTTQERSIKAVSKVILNVVSAMKGFTVMTSSTHIVVTSMKGVISVTGRTAVASSSITLIIMHSKFIFEKIISFARIKTAWTRSLWFLGQRWISRPIS